MNVLFVGLHNVCRSPLAEAILKKKFEENNIDGIVDSAGFEAFTINEPPDNRVVKVGEHKGVKVEGKARIFLKEDFDKFDKIYVMDANNYHDVIYLARNDDDKAKVDYLLNVMEKGTNRIVPNPYYTGVSDCHTIYDLIDKATDKIVEEAKSEKDIANVATN